jgi:Holin of 3TMs, for gene-transfer release
MANEQVTSEQKKEDWMNSKWRPMMGWMYMLVCMFDMIVFPILWSLLQTVTHTPITQWNPLTLQGAGLFHIAMGAVLGIAAFGRTQEKLNGANNGGATVPSSNFTAPSAPSAGFGASTGGFGATAPATGFGGATPSVAPTPASASSFGSGFGSTPPDTTASGKKIVPDFGQPAI